MKERFIIAPDSIVAELMDAELQVVAARGLLEDVIAPIFGCRNRKGAVDTHLACAGGNNDKAASLWMDENYDSLYAAYYATSVLIAEAADILQLFPVPHKAGACIKRRSRFPTQTTRSGRR